MGHALLRTAWAGIRRRPAQSAVTLALLIVVTAALVVALAMRAAGSRPYERLFDDTNGAHLTLWANPDVDLEPIASLPETNAVSDPVPYVYTTGPFGSADAHEARLMAVDEPPRVARPQVVSGRWLDGSDDEIVLERSFATAIDADVGATVPLPTADGDIGVEVVGIAVISHRGPYPGSTPATTYVAPAVLDRVDPQRADRYQWLAVRIADPQATTAFTAAIDRAVEGPVFSLSWHDVRSGMLAGAQISAAGLMAFALFTLVAVGLIIANAISGRVLAGTRQIGILKALGLTPAQVTAALVGEYVALAGVAALIGVPVGLVAVGRLADDVARSMNTTPLDILDPVLVLSSVGIVIGVVAAFTVLPSWRAARIPPVQAIRVGLQPPRTRPSRLAHLAASAGLGPVIALGARDAFVRPLRSVRAIAALVLTVVAVSFTLDLDATVRAVADDPSLRGQPVDVFVSVGDVPIDTARARVAEAPEVIATAVSHWASATVGANADQVDVSLLTGDYQELGHTIQGGRMMRNAGEAVMSFSVHQQHGIDLGDRVDLGLSTFDDRGRPQPFETVQVTVVGQALLDGGDFLVDGRTATPPPEAEPVIQASTAPGADPEAVAARIAARGPDGIQASPVERGVPQEIAVLRRGLRALAGILVAIAMVNLLATTYLAVRERRRDIGVLASIGLTPRQVVGALTTSSAILAVVATLVGIPLGRLASRLTYDLGGRAIGFGSGFGEYASWPTLALVLPAVALLAMAAAALPARAAVRVPVTQALRDE